MSEIPADLRYTRSHEWIRELPGGEVELGITEHAQHELGDVVFVELPEVGRKLEAGASYAVVESVKAAADVYCPLAGEVTAVNPALGASPELINRAPYGEGWLARVRPAGPLPALLSAQQYQQVLESEGA